MRTESFARAGTRGRPLELFARPPTPIPRTTKLRDRMRLKRFICCTILVTLIGGAAWALTTGKFDRARKIDFAPLKSRVNGVVENFKEYFKSGRLFQEATEPVKTRKAATTPLAGNGSVDLAALMIFYYETGGGKTWHTARGWMTDQPINEWQGVTVAPASGRVVGLDLRDLGLTGRLPGGALGYLTALEELTLDHNELEGGIPDEISKLTSLRKLNLAYNRLSGPVPALLCGALGAGEEGGGRGAGGAGVKLLLNRNRFEGEVPECLARLPEDALVDLSGNKGLSGFVPDSVSAWRKEVGKRRERERQATAGSRTSKTNGVFFGPGVGPLSAPLTGGAPPRGKIEGEKGENPAPARQTSREAGKDAGKGGGAKAREETRRKARREARFAAKDGVKPPPRTEPAAGSGSRAGSMSRSGIGLLGAEGEGDDRAERRKQRSSSAASKASGSAERLRRSRQQRQRQQAREQERANAAAGA
mmetsp:Transcript_17619/g.40452  ORF Transcript_17619/g.40452 Transcript_17619/m.40452 type:complete len:477 (+) Transcript_17619:174-1604(+)